MIADDLMIFVGVCGLLLDVEIGISGQMFLEGGSFITSASTYKDLPSIHSVLNPLLSSLFIYYRNASSLHAQPTGLICKSHDAVHRTCINTLTT